MFKRQKTLFRGTTNLQKFYSRCIIGCCVIIHKKSENDKKWRLEPFGTAQSICCMVLTYCRATMCHTCSIVPATYLEAVTRWRVPATTSSCWMLKDPTLLRQTPAQLTLVRTRTKTNVVASLSGIPLLVRRWIVYSSRVGCPRRGLSRMHERGHSVC